MRTKTLWIKDEYLGLILAGRKTIEVRVGYSNIERLQVGDRLLLNDQHPFVIRRIGHYASFEELLAREDAASIAPDVPPGQLLETLRATTHRRKRRWASWRWRLSRNELRFARDKSPEMW